MITKDHYVVLGIPRDETPHGIRSAFRDLARRHHPDRAGPDATPQFREVVDAYRVLSDPERRRAYDAQLLEHERPPARVERPATRIPRRRRFRGVDVLGRSESVRPSLEELLERLFRGFGDAGPRKGEGPEPLLCDVALEPEEALHGGLLPLRLPVLAPCARCHGTGRIGGFACPVCDSRGDLCDEVVIPLDVPPGVRAGTVIEIPLEAWGVRNLWLRARIDVRA